MWDATHRISTAHVSSNGNIYVTGIQEDTCNNNTCNRNSDLYDKNIKTSNACIPVNIYITVMYEHDITVYRASI